MMQKFSYSSFTFGSYLTPTVKILIIINIVVFILIHLIPTFPWLAVFGLVPGYVFSKFMIWQLFTYMFVHFGLWHLVINMLMLWFFAPAIESAWGRKQFLFYYFFTGIGAGFCSFITSFHSYIPVIGASGSIFGILVAYAIMFPETIILLFFFIPMKIKHAVFILAGINLLGAISNKGSDIAYFAHLGGGLFGYLYLKSEWFRIHLSYLNPEQIKLKLIRKRILRKKLEKEKLNKQIDEILDKISKHGINSLSKKERKILEQRSKGKI